MTLESRLRRAAEGIHRAVETNESPMKMDEQTRIERFDRFRRRADRNRAFGAIVLVGTLIVVAFAFATTWMARDTSHVVPADDAATPVPTHIGTVTITTSGCTLDGTMNAALGPFTVTVRSETAGPRDVLVFNVATDAHFHRLLRYVERLKAGKAEWDYDRINGSRVGGLISTTVDGQDALTVSGTMDRGTYLIVCSRKTVPTAAGQNWPIFTARPTDFIGPIEVR